ncbi:unnamed protein product [Acanthoscelides obtectus]|uniref:Malate dehydrogenase n=1 Tax=Acanthoscelides obtectus TaxID=200917 RepID=A0A9P0LWU1_ACAOB|nr:unnamed protein product [Acanthoscelides obtectus]CAK1643153.1 Malate dehydrogenase [Acanthoscelides obtectus]
MHKRRYKQFLMLQQRYVQRSKRAERPRIITPPEEARRFMYECLRAVGMPEGNAAVIADNLLEADLRGLYSHGMNRLERYIKDVKQGSADGAATPVVVKESTSAAVVDGRNSMGSVVGTFCMDLAIEKAKATGIGIAVAFNSNHFGIAGIYAKQAIKQGCVGLIFSNTTPIMVPTRAKEPALGTNPLAMGAPGKGDEFVLDIATTAVAIGKIEYYKRKNEPIPEGWALNEAGEVEIDPNVALKAGKLMPLGGTELNSGYKGFGLGMFVEILCGILSGSNYGPLIPKWGANAENRNLGHCFIAIDPKHFTPGFEDRMTDLMDIIRNLEPVDPKRPVLVPGDVERQHEEKVRKYGGLCYIQNQHDTNAKLAQELGVKPMGSVAAKPICSCKNKNKK